MTIKSFLHFTINELRLRFTHLCPVQFEEQVYGIGLCSIPPAVIVKNYELVLFSMYPNGNGYMRQFGSSHGYQDQPSRPIKGNNY